jgi:membrane protein
MSEQAQSGSAQFVELLKQTFREWQEDQVTRQAAALAYFTLLSTAPMLILIISIAGIAFGQQDVQNEVVSQVRQALGTESAELIEDILEATYQPGAGTLATVVGIVMMFIGASNIFNQLQISLNHIWKVRPKPETGIFNMIKNRVVAVVMVLGAGFLLLLSLAAQTALSLFLSLATDLTPGLAPALRLLNFAVFFLVITLLFAMIYRFLPNAQVAWGDVWMGAVVTSLLFALGQVAFGLYIAHSGVSSAYGAAGSLVVILLWIYYSAVILLLGAEFTQVYARMFGSKIRAARGYTRPIADDPSPDAASASEES